MPYMVKEVADLTGVTVRTLHYYDQIGLLKPTSVNSAGYRLYSNDDLETLQQVLFFKELDFSLEEIKEILNSPGYNRKESLIAHKKLLIEKKERLERIIAMVDKTINTIEGGINMSKKEMFEVFDMGEINKHKEKYAEEVRQKYDKKVVEECERKTSKYTENDWARILNKAGEIYQKIASKMDRGPADSEVQEAVAEFRQHINDNFYTCTLEIFRGLGDLYVEDERFTKNIDKIKPGLARFLKEAMHIYCDNHKQ